MRIYKHISWCVFFVIFSFRCLAYDTDSLRSEIDRSSGTMRIELIKELLFKANRYDQSYRPLISEFMEHAAQNADAEGIALGRFYEGNYFLDMRLLDSAYMDFSIALNYYTKVNDSTKISSIYSNIGIALKQWGANKKAIEAYQNSNAYCRADQKKTFAQNYYNTAVLYTNIADFPNALKYINLAEEALEELDNSYGKALILYQKSNIYYELHQWGQNLDYALRTNEHIEKNNISSLRIYSYLGIALAYNKLKNRTKALIYTDSARALVRESTTKTELASIEKCYGLIYFAGRQYNKSAEALYRSFEYFKQDNMMKLAIEALDTLALAYVLDGKPQKAIEIQKMRIHLSDSLSLVKIEKGIANAYSQMEIERTLNQIDQLKSENDISKLTIRSQYQTIAVILLTLIASLLAFLLFFKYYRKVRALNKSLNESYSIISESKAEIINQLETIREKNAEQSLLLDSLTKSEYELRIANATKDRLFSIISHDLKGPVAYYVSNLQTLKETFETMQPKELENEIDMLISSSQKLILLLKNLLVWSGLQRNTVKYERKTEDLAELLRSAVEPLLFQADFRKISIAYENCQSEIICDSDIISTIIRNLVSNSIKHSRHAGQISIRYEKIGDISEIIVADNGYGISPEILHNIETENHLGIIQSSMSSGLGIMLCRELARIHEGVLSFDSTVDLGTNARLRFK